MSNDLDVSETVKDTVEQLISHQRKDCVRVGEDLELHICERGRTGRGENKKSRLYKAVGAWVPWWLVQID